MSSLRTYIAASLLLTSALALSGCDYTVVSTADLQSTQQQITELKNKQAEIERGNTKASLDDQAKCAKQAQVYINQNFGNKKDSLGDVKNHYSSKLNKCFVCIPYNDGENHKTTVYLYDAFEWEEYWEFSIDYLAKDKSKEFSCYVDIFSVDTSSIDVNFLKSFQEKWCTNGEMDFDFLIGILYMRS